MINAVGGGQAEIGQKVRVDVVVFGESENVIDFLRGAVRYHRKTANERKRIPNLESTFHISD